MIASSPLSPIPYFYSVGDIFADRNATPVLFVHLHGSNLIPYDYMILHFPIDQRKEKSPKMLFQTRGIVARSKPK